ncbi:MAG TPA: hypothetical protein VN923_13910 [Thermoanaerobaculia bacterium]|nr:hypothetical protein [Thermoanaerobaculia bacterium]
MGARATAAIVVALLVAVSAGGCRDAAEQRAESARAQEWAALQRDKRTIDGERGELRRLRGRLAAVPIAADGTPLAAGDAAIAREVALREERLAARSSHLGDRLVHYLGGFVHDAGGSPPGWNAAVRMKSDEDLAVAQEWIDRGGDYRRAIEILETQRALDPGDERLTQALVRAREMRFVTPERFARVQAGMSPIDVRAALGPVNLREVLRRPAEQLEAWYYPKRGGGKAAVYFRYEEGRRGYVVYQTDLAAGASRPAPPAQVS